MAELTGKQRRHLRGLGHHLKPAVIVGREGLSATLLQTADEYLRAHELLKVKVLEACPLGTGEVAEEMAGALEAEKVQRIGRTLLLYRPAEEPVIRLP